MNPRICFAIAATALAAFAAEPPPPKDFLLGKDYTFKSTVLGEDRPLRIFTPSDYTSARSSYPTLPVLYLLDGPGHYVHVVGLVDFLAKQGRIPPMIVVAIGNTNRTRDLTPTNSRYVFGGRTEEDFAASGGAGKFFEFMRDELIPHVEKNYRAAPFRILDGHSFGGLFALKVLHDSPATFQALIAVSPSLWWERGIMLKHSGAIGLARQYLYLSVGNEGGEHRQAIDRYADKLRQNATPGFLWAYKAYERESHGSVPHETLYDGLKFIFAGWHLPDATLDSEPVTVAEATEHYRRLSAKYGFEIPLPLPAIRNMGGTYAFLHRWDDAIAAYKEAARRFPNSAETHADLAGIYLKKGDKISAESAFKKTLEINPQNSAAKRGLKKLTGTGSQ
jgi:predicted alpha/beta superfamily hydrolase